MNCCLAVCTVQTLQSLVREIKGHQLLYKKMFGWFLKMFCVCVKLISETNGIQISITPQILDTKHFYTLRVTYSCLELLICHFIFIF